MDRSTARCQPCGPQLALVLAAAACAATNPAAHRHDRLVDGRVEARPVPPPEAYAAYLEAALALERGGDLAAALAAVDRALAYEGRDPHPWVLRARILAAAGRPEDAEASLAEALARSPGYPPARRLAGRLAAGTATRARAPE